MPELGEVLGPAEGAAEQRDELVVTVALRRQRIGERLPALCRVLTWIAGLFRRA